MTPLHLSCACGQLAIVRCLTSISQILLGANDNKGKTAIHIAAEHGHLNIVKYLVEEKQCEINVENIAKAIPLYLACGHGHFPVKYLTSLRTCTILRDHLIATENGHLEIVKYFLDMMTRLVNATGSNLCTPLHLAYINRHQSIVKFLIFTHTVSFKR